MSSERANCLIFFPLIRIVELVPDNLKKLCNLLTDARPNWFKLGFQLDIQLTELTIIEMNRKDVDACYIEMLSTWLKMIDPQPSWDGLLTALEHESVKCENLADNIRKKYGIPKHTPTATLAANTLLQQTEPGPSETPACQLMHHFHAFIIISMWGADIQTQQPSLVQVSLS